jgi:hypothetical protein
VALSSELAGMPALAALSAPFIEMFFHVSARHCSREPLQISMAEVEEPDRISLPIE